MNSIDEQSLALLELVPWQFDSQPDLVEASPAVDDLATLRHQVASCTRCPLAESRSQTVFGSGHEHAQVMFIGEAPGSQEDQQGLPFVGRAGQLLNSMLHAMGLSREQIFIANVLKCRPPQNRDPNQAEVEACTAYLEQQIQLIDPQIVVALGRHAAHYLLKTDRTLSRLRSQWHEYQGRHLLVTYHPAYLLRNPTDKSKAWDDLCMLKQKLAVSD